jgi:hypothetical protein
MGSSLDSLRAYTKCRSGYGLPERRPDSQRKKDGGSRRSNRRLGHRPNHVSGQLGDRRPHFILRIVAELRSPDFQAIVWCDRLKSAAE